MPELITESLLFLLCLWVVIRIFRLLNVLHAATALGGDDEQE